MGRVSLSDHNVLDPCLVGRDDLIHKTTAEQRFEGDEGADHEVSGEGCSRQTE